jgi:hypothetical protein
MKKALFVLVCLLTVFAFTSGVMAQQSTTSSKVLKASGTVLAYHIQEMDYAFFHRNTPTQCR